MPQKNQKNQKNQTNQTNQNNTGIYLLFGGVSLLILGFIFVFWILPMFQKNLSVDCSGNWTIWSECDATCDGSTAISSNPGTRKRTYIVKTPASNQGVSCPISPETETCTKIDCPVNCMGYWDRWTDCDATCDGINPISSRTGTRKRTYTVTTPASNQGASCPISQETATCIKIDCPVNCMGNWDRWTDCDATCDGINASVSGRTTRTFTVITPDSNRGVSCPISPETETCTKTNCPINCIGTWDRWSDCDSTCDGINTISPIPGTRSRTFRVTTVASNGGSCPILPEIDSKCIKSGCLAKIVATTITPIVLVGLNPTQQSSGEKYVVFNYTSDSVGLSGQTEYTFNVTSNNINATILIVGGGGGGGATGGGGGGGDVSLNNITLPIGTHKIRVGRGGNGGPLVQNAQSGYNSELILQSGTIYTYYGGGRGASSYSFQSAQAGLTNNTYSSGGGGGGCGGYSGDITVTYGKSGNGFSGNGGNGGKDPQKKGGGGGAAPGPEGNGIDGTSNGGGNGGKGITSNITGENVGYGGGGGGGGDGGIGLKPPGLGFDGGGRGGIDTYNNAIAGINGGGGGGGYDAGANGGHGVVIIRYTA
jgi:hypothetical protein